MLTAKKETTIRPANVRKLKDRLSQWRDDPHNLGPSIGRKINEDGDVASTSQEQPKLYICDISFVGICP